MPFTNPFKSPKVAQEPQPIADLDNCAKLVYDNAQLNELVEKLLEKNAEREKKAIIDNEERKEKARIDIAAKEYEKRKYSDDINKAHIKLSEIATPIENIIRDRIINEIHKLRT